MRDNVIRLVGPTERLQRPSDQRARCHTCLWCKTPFSPRKTGGSAQRFCSKDCRAAFHTAARRWAIQAIDDSRLDVVDLKPKPKQGA
jgi:hypothetical protein